MQVDSAKQLEKTRQEIAKKLDNYDISNTKTQLQEPGQYLLSSRNSHYCFFANKLSSKLSFSSRKH